MIDWYSLKKLIESCQFFTVRNSIKMTCKIFDCKNEPTKYLNIDGNKYYLCETHTHDAIHEAYKYGSIELDIE